MKTFLNGLGLVIPTALILYILIWVLTNTELFFKKILLLFIPFEYYISGMGFILGLVAVYIIGLLLKFWIIQAIRDFFEKLIDKTPIISSIYGIIKDLFSFISNFSSRHFSNSANSSLPKAQANSLALSS